MKEITDRLFWVHLYLTDPEFGKNPANRDLVLEELNGAIAIAEALPELTYKPGTEPKPARQPPERIIERPNA